MRWRIPPVNGTARGIIVSVAVLLSAPLAVLHAADAPRPATTSSLRADKTAPRPNVLIIGASSLVGLPYLVGTMLESKGIQMNIDGKGPRLDAVTKTLSSRPVWDYLVMDAWHFGKGRTDPPEYSKAVAGFVKEVRAHSPKCKIILFSWWIPYGPTATNAGVMNVFRRCVEEAKANNIWVATTGPAFMEARLARPDLHVTRDKNDAHPGIHGTYINACSLFAVITGQSPVGLPATLTTTARGNFSPDTEKKNRPAPDVTLAPKEAKYLQDLAWKIYQREIKNTKPAE